MASTLAQYLNDPTVVVILLGTGLVIYYAARYCVRLTLQSGYENAFMDYVEELILREEERTHQRYENAFMDYVEELVLREAERTNQPLRFIPLTFQRRGAEDLFALCLASKSRLKPGYNSYRDHLRENPPSIETNLIRLRWIMKRDDSAGLLRLQMIRCDNSHSLVEGGDGRTAYILKRDNNERQHHNVPTFNIDSKFRYRQETAEGPRDQGVELMSVTTDQHVRDHILPSAPPV